MTDRDPPCGDTGKKRRKRQQQDDVHVDGKERAEQGGGSGVRQQRRRPADGRLCRGMFHPVYRRQVTGRRAGQEDEKLQQRRQKFTGFHGQRSFLSRLPAGLFCRRRIWSK